MGPTAADVAAPAGRPGRPAWQNPWLAPLLGLVCMASSLGNDFTYDDNPMVRDNPRLHSLRDVRAIWLSNWWHTARLPEELNARYEPLYRPLTLFTFALNYAAGGLDPLGYHLVNILLHTLACALVAPLARRLTGDDTVAALAAVLFAVHPVHSEAVAGIVGRAEVLAALFLLLGLLVLLPADGRYRGTRAAWAAPLFLLALLAKETAICYPAVALLGLHALRRRQPIRMRAWFLTLVSLAIPLLIYFPLRYVALGGRLIRTSPAGFILNPVNIANDVGERVVGALTVLGHYARLFGLPARLSSDYGLAVIDPRLGMTAIAAVGALTLIAALVGLLGYGRNGRHWPTVATLTAISLASYALVSNTVLLIGVSVAERLAYWPSVPVLILAAYGIVTYWRHFTGPGGLLQRSARLLAVLGVLFVVALGARTTVRNWDWRDNLALVEQDVAVWPRSVVLNHGYAFELTKLAAEVADPVVRKRILGQAEPFVIRALEIEPTFVDALVLRARIRAELDDPDAAFLYVEAALYLEPHDRDAQQVAALLRQGPVASERRLNNLRQAVADAPDDPERRVALGHALLQHGLPVAARAELEQALALDPDDPLALRLLGEALAAAGEDAQACTVLRQVLAREPEEWRSHANLSALLADVDPPAALYHALEAYRLQPNDLRTNVNLAEAYAINGRGTDALAMYQHILAGLGADDPFRRVIQARIQALQR